MNKKATLYKLGEKYILFLGTWLDCRKIKNALHLKHLVLSQDEVDYIKARKRARFKWDEQTKTYDLAASDADNPQTISQLILEEKDKAIYIGKLRKGIFSWEIARQRAAQEGDNRKPSDYLG